MDVKKPTVADILLNADTTYVIPPYQRPYKWNAARWQTLIQDILKKVTSPEKNHWLGMFITTASEDQNVVRSYNHKYIDVIDGQQRLVTLRIWLQAVIDHAKENNIPLEGRSEIKFAELICQEADKQELALILNGQWRHKWKTYKVNSTGLLHCYTYFRWVLWLGESALLPSEPDRLPRKLNNESDLSLPLESQWEKELEARMRRLENDDDGQDFQFQASRSTPPNCDALIRATLNHLSLVELVLEKAIDEEPAEIFEALNGMRLELAQFDHVRNYLFTGIPTIEKRRALYDNDWKHVEFALSKSKQTIESADTFLYDFLISKGETKYQKPFSKQRTASHFSRYFATRSSGNHEEVAREEVLPNLISWMSIKSNGEKFDVNGHEYLMKSDSKRRLRSMESLSSGPLVPLLINLTKRYYFENNISEDALNRQLFSLEVFLGRKVLNRTALSPLRSEMMALSARLGAKFSEDELISSLQALSPSNDEIRDRLLPAKVNSVIKYPDSAHIANKRAGGLSPRQLLAIFQGMEEHLSGKLRTNLIESTGEEIFSIEHIYPQEDILWRDELRSWSQSQPAMESRLHTIGNLGIIPDRLNSELSNKSFREKREIVSDPVKKFPILRVNEYWTDSNQTRWRAEEIDERANRLINTILAFWKF
jgi:hypothetical protein